MAKVEETYSPKPLAASGQLISVSGGGSIGGFVCITSGTIKLTQGTDGAGTTIVDTCAVTAGVFLPLPFTIPPGTGAYVTLAGGAAGTFAVNNA